MMFCQRFRPLATYADQEWNELRYSCSRKDGQFHSTEAECALVKDSTYLFAHLVCAARHWLLGFGKPSMSSASRGLVLGIGRQ